MNGAYGVLTTGSSPIYGAPFRSPAIYRRAVGAVEYTRIGGRDVATNAGLPGGGGGGIYPNSPGGTSPRMPDRRTVGATEYTRIAGRWGRCIVTIDVNVVPTARASMPST